MQELKAKALYDVKLAITLARTEKEKQELIELKTWIESQK